MSDLQRNDLVDDEPVHVRESVESAEQSYRYIGSDEYRGHRVEYLECGWKSDVPTLDTRINAYAPIQRDMRRPQDAIPNVTYCEHEEEETWIGVDTAHARNQDMDLAERFEDATRQIREALDAVEDDVQCLRCDRLKPLKPSYGWSIGRTMVYLCEACYDTVVDEEDKTED